ncbi:nicotinamide-nucleotide amidohydrolase family protein [Psychrosphaera sp.]|nr:nicotinamide-nucleotide amidohydrolase family protein [Psychrosphaera sp.]
MPKRIEALEKLATQLIEKNWTVTTAESCTGGGISSAITELAGSSTYFNQAFVTYSNDSKQSLVGVKGLTLDSYGAVSEQTVKEMAVGALIKANANVAIAVSGIAGPGGGTENKPVGTVWFAFAVRDNNTDVSKISLFSELRVFDGDRSLVREQAVNYALNHLVSLIC